MTYDFPEFDSHAKIIQIGTCRRIGFFCSLLFIC